MVRVETVLESWRTVRQDAAQAVLDLPGGELAYRPGDELMTFGEIARHILEAGHGLTGLLLAGEDNMATPEFRQKIREYQTELPAGASPEALAAEMNRAVEQRIEELRKQPQDFYAGIVTRFDGQRVTRLEMLQFVKEHELTHRSQLFLYLRLRGVVPPTTRRKMAKK
jgi:uncharacterized damage-inducible protein DinB